MKRGVKIGKNTTISKSVTMQDGVIIGDNVILEGKITVGSGTRIDHGTIIRGMVNVGKNNWIYPHCIIGTGSQHIEFKEKDIRSSITKDRAIKIGDNNIIREFTTIHLPTVKKHTCIGSECYIMAYCHIAHDCIVHDGVIITNKTTLSGHVEIFEHANIGLDNNIHQYRKIGAHAMLGMGNSIAKDVPPFALINRQKFTKINEVGLERHGVKKSDVKKIKAIYMKGLPPKNAKTWFEKEIAEFLKNSTAYYPPKLKS